MPDKIYKIAKFEELYVGQKESFSHSIKLEDVLKFAEVSGDFNPLHLEDDFIKNTHFKRPVVHGILNASLVSQMIGMRLPGPGALWISQNFEFLSPAYVGDTISIEATIIAKSNAVRIVTIQIKVINQNGVLLIEGTGKVGVVELKIQENQGAIVHEVQSLVVGGSRGIGAETAKTLARRGDSVCIIYNSSLNKAMEVIDEIEKCGGKAFAMKADVTNVDDMEKLMLKLSEMNFFPENVIYCASQTPHPIKFEDETWENQAAHLDTQIKGSFYFVKKLVPAMLQKKTGNFVFVSSIYGEGQPPSQQTSYVVAKAALNGLMRALAVEYGPQGIRFNCVSPGMTDTDMIEGLPQKTKLTTKMSTPLRKLASVVDIAHAIAFLTDNLSTHISGINLPVSGGIRG